MVIFFVKSMLKMAEYKEEIVVRSSVEQMLYVFDTIGIKFPEVALAQAIHETNMFSSKICRQNHNLFGMKESSRNYDIGTNRGHAMYPHVGHRGLCNIQCFLPSLYDYRDWQQQMMPLDKIKTNNEYIYYLQNRPNGLKYAEDPKYPQRISHYLKIIDECLSNSSLASSSKE